MADMKVKFIKILKAELEDLREDIAIAEGRYADRFARQEITEYVYKENDALFRKETDSLNRFIQAVDAIDVSLYTSVRGVAEALESLVKDTVEGFEDPEAIYLFVSRKLQKVLTYTESVECS